MCILWMSADSIKISAVPPSISPVHLLSLSSTNTAISRGGVGGRGNPKVVLMQIQSAFLQGHLHVELSAFVQ